MKRNFILASFIILSVFIVSLFSCKKIYLATELGQGLIPAVDNIHTFDTTLEVFAYNNIFDPAADTFRSIYSDEQFLGRINNDPVFGKTDAKMYFQISPGKRFTFQNSAANLYLDSVVLILDYVNTYGDTIIPQTIQVSEIAQSNDFRYDSLYYMRKNDWVTTNVLGTKTVLPYTLNDSVFIKGTEDSTTVSQLRIRLDNSFGHRLLSYDTAGLNNAFYDDSVFKTFFKGFELKSTGSGNALMGFNLNSTDTKLAIYYRYDNKTTPGDIDTTVQYFRFTSSPNAATNSVVRNYSGTLIPGVSGDNVADQLVYIQNTPGTYARLKIPGLTNLSNRIVHLAELSMESVYDASDTLFGPPSDIFMDVDSAGKYMTIPYVFTYTTDIYTGATTISNYSSFYSNAPYYYKLDASGNRVKQWRFNLTNYVQNIANHKVSLYDFRLYANPAFNLQNGTPGYSKIIKIQPQSYVVPVAGRVRLGGGQHSTQKMKLRIVYSKI